MNQLPAFYLDAEVRNVTPYCNGRARLGLGLDIAGLPTVRVALTLDHARFLRDCMDDFINSAAGALAGAVEST